MATKKLNKVFLSASIPYADRDKKYFETADIVAIRDAVRALATVVIPKCHLIWGGHPSITPLIRFVCEKMDVYVKTHVTLYQSLFFEDKFPSDNFAFEDIVLTDRKETQEDSIKFMRQRLIIDNDFKAGIFIGGMEGIGDEFNIFREIHPNAKILPIASTGAAAAIIFNEHRNLFNDRLLNDYAYMSMFRDLLTDIL